MNVWLLIYPYRNIIYFEVIMLNQRQSHINLQRTYLRFAPPMIGSQSSDGLGMTAIDFSHKKQIVKGHYINLIWRMFAANHVKQKIWQYQYQYLQERKLPMKVMKFSTRPPTAELWNSTRHHDHYGFERSMILHLLMTTVMMMGWLLMVNLRNANRERIGLSFVPYGLTRLCCTSSPSKREIPPWNISFVSWLFPCEFGDVTNLWLGVRSILPLIRSCWLLKQLAFNWIQRHVSKIILMKCLPRFDTFNHSIMRTITISSKHYSACSSGHWPDHHDRLCRLSYKIWSL